MSSDRVAGFESVWTITPQQGVWKVGRSESNHRPQEQTLENLNEIAQRITKLEASKANLESQLQEDRAELTSLREEVKLFSTFEQICNSGMLRNFKIDPEGDFAQVILGLLQRTMELQINHLTGPSRTGRPKLIQGTTAQSEAS